MDERVALPPLPSAAPGESARIALVRALYVELDGKVLMSQLQTAMRFYAGELLDFPVPEEVRQRMMADREHRRELDAPLDSAQVDAIFATALHDWQGETARRMHAIGLTPLLPTKFKLRFRRTEGG
jgi:hypothetical protein